MIIKGSSRANPNQLARHLQRADTNERVQVIQLDSPTGDLVEAFRDWQLLSTGTRGTKGLYHANIDPDARYQMTPEQWQRAVDVLEKELGFEGQPRAVVMHEKHGRQHVHVVWQRTDIETMKLIPDSFNYKAHERASLALEQEFGHEIVPGKHAKRDRDKQPELPKAEISHAEWQQGERAGVDPRAFKDAITALYRQSDSGQALQQALEERGLLLAKGDRRDFVIVDENSQVYSLARQIKGVTAKDLRAFMADLDRDALPDAEAAKALQQERSANRQPEPGKETVPVISEEERERIRQAIVARHADEAGRLEAAQASEYRETERILTEDIEGKLQDYDAVQKAALDRYDREHPDSLDGFAGMVAAIKARIMPRRAAEEKQERDDARAAFVRELADERTTYVQSLTDDKDRDLRDLRDRHAQQQRNQAAGLERDLTRYVQEREAAEQLRIELERQQEEERAIEHQRNRDGPPLGLDR
jgi:hypothetical protein